MYINIMLTDGSVVRADATSENDLIRQFGGNMSYQECCDRIEASYSNLSEVRGTSIRVNGQMRSINTNHILWVEVIR